VFLALLFKLTCFIFLFQHLLVFLLELTLILLNVKQQGLDLGELILIDRIFLLQLRAEALYLSLQILAPFSVFFKLQVLFLEFLGNRKLLK